MRSILGVPWCLVCRSHHLRAADHLGPDRWPARARARFYAAGSRDALADVRALTAALTELGFEPAFDWTEHADHACSVTTCGVRDRRALAEAEVRAAAEADLFVGVARMGKGAHIEMGVALGAAHVQGRTPRLLLVGVWDGAGESDSIFYEHEAAVHVEDVAAAAATAARMLEENA
jgi:hypothetical protein